MATQNITITYPDGQASRILDALKEMVTRQDETNQNPTNQDALDWFEQFCGRQLKSLVVSYEREQAAQAVTEPDVT